MLHLNHFTLGLLSQLSKWPLNLKFFSSIAFQIKSISRPKNHDYYVVCMQFIGNTSKLLGALLRDPLKRHSVISSDSLGCLAASVPVKVSQHPLFSKIKAITLSCAALLRLQGFTVLPEVDKNPHKVIKEVHLLCLI